MPSPHAIIHIQSGNQAQFLLSDIIDILSNYAKINFIDEELIFLDSKYPFILLYTIACLTTTMYYEKDDHKFQHDVLLSLYFYM